MTQAQKKKVVSYKNDNVLEALGGMSSSVVSTTTQEVGKIGSDVLTSLFGGPAASGELRPNEPIELAGEKPQEAPRPEPRVELQPRPDLGIIEKETKNQIEAIRAELKALMISLKGLHQEVQTAVSEQPVNPGIYHLNFFERLRAFLKILRQQIEDSRTWLATFNSRKKKMGYWGMYKKHGTTFGLSNERSLATSAG